MEVSALELSLLLKEMAVLIGCIVDNVYQLEDSSVVIKLRCKGSDLELRASAGRCIYFTSKSYPKPKSPTPIAMSMRRFLNGLRVAGIEQLGSERIAVLSFNGRRDLKLIVELLPKGNMVLVDEGGKILVSLFRARMKDREIGPGKQYVPPPKRFSLMDGGPLDSLVMDARSNKKTISWIASELGLGKKYAEEVLEISGVDGQIPVADLDEVSRKKLICAISELLRSFRNPAPMVAKKDDEVKAIPFYMRSMERRGYQLVSVGSFNEAISLECEAWVAAESKRLVKEDVVRKVEDLKKDLGAKQKVVMDLDVKVNSLKVLTDKIFPMLSELEGFRKRFMESRVDPPHPFKLMDYNPERRAVKLSIDGCEFELSLDVSVSKQLEKFYEEMKKIKEIRKKVLGEIEGVKGEISKLEAELASLTITPIEVKKKEEKPARWYERFRWFETSSGLLAVGGKDASSNIVLLKRYLEPGDLVFHAEIPGSPVVILKGGRSADEGSIEEAVEFTASYSRAWREGLSSISVFYITPEQVSFTPPSGQYLPRGSFIVKGKRNYLRARLRLAFGILPSDSGVELKFGPLNSVLSKAKNVIEIIPGSIDAKTLSKIILDRLLELSGLELDEESKSSLEERIASLIPYGKGAVAERG